MLAHRSKIIFGIFFVVVVFTAMRLLWPTPAVTVSPRSHAVSIDAAGDGSQVDAPAKSQVDSTKAAYRNGGNGFACGTDFDLPDLDLEIVAAALSESQDSGYRLMAALYWPDRGREAEFLALNTILEADPENRLIVWHLLTSCSRFPEFSQCTDDTIENRSINVDGSNGQLWARIAGFRIGRGDMSGALDALRNATAAPRFSDYKTEHIELFGRGLAAVGNAPYRGRVIQAIGMQAALASNEYEVVMACKKMAVESAVWLTQCLRLGERLERDGRSVSAVVAGQGLQKTMHSISGDSEQAALLEERRGLTREFLENGLSKDSGILLSRDEQALANYISELATYGELRALQSLKNEVERLKKLPDYNPC